VLRVEINIAIGGFSKKQKAADIKTVTGETVTLKALWSLYVPPV
jgi:hypothetical protein